MRRTPLIFNSDAVVSTADYEHKKNAMHYYFSEPATEEAVLERAAALSQELPVAALTQEAGGCTHLKELLGAKAEL
ncbi:hypothetical protein BG006_010771, partial [Podila minutissima]